MMARSKMAYAMTDELSEALVEINNETKFENTLVKYPIYVQQPYNLCGAARALWCVLLPYYLFKSRKYNFHKILLFDMITIYYTIYANKRWFDEYISYYKL